MSGPRLYGGLATLLFVWSCLPGLAATPDSAPVPVAPLPGPGDAGTSDLAAPNSISNPVSNPVYPVALPVDTDSSGGPILDASGHRKFYTISAYLRETYDDNVGTTNSDKQASLETALSPSVLVTFPPSRSSTFSGRYTMDITYYSTKGSLPGNSGSLEVTHEAVATYGQTLSDRLSFNLAEQFRYFTEPSVYENTGTFYRDGAYASNAFNAAATLQITPLIGSSSSYSSNIVRYDSSAVGDLQNSVENIVSQSFSRTILPTISANVGAVVDQIQYQDSRGYVSTSVFGGASWTPTPNISASARAGASYTRDNQSNAQGSNNLGDEISPYAAISGSWQTSKHTSVSFDYSHSITPTGQSGANGQLSDRINASGHYSITTSLSAGITGVFTHLSVSDAQISAQSSQLNSYSENEYALRLDLSYQLDAHFSLDAGINVFGVSSEIQDQSYARNELTFGIRGTY